MLPVFSQAYELDWGNVTPEGFNRTSREVLHVFNVDISTSESVQRCIFFSIGKIVWTNFHLLENKKQKVVFDFRGQSDSVDKFQKIKNDILDGVKSQSPLIDIIIEIRS